MKGTVVKLIAFLTLGLFAAPLVAGAQQAGQIHRIGYLGAGSRGPAQQVLEQALRERGWVTGENLVIAYRYAAERIALLRNPANAAALPAVKIVMEAAQTLGVELQVVDARAPEEFESAFRAMARARADALLVYGDAAFFRHLGRLADLSLRQRLPTVCSLTEFTEGAGLMTYSVNRPDVVRQVAGYVDSLLRGANPGELPVERPTKFEIVINRKTAKALGVTIPPSLPVQAGQVIE